MTGGRGWLGCLFRWVLWCWGMVHLLGVLLLVRSLGHCLLLGVCSGSRSEKVECVLHVCVCHVGEGESGSNSKGRGFGVACVVCGVGSLFCS